MVRTRTSTLGAASKFVTGTYIGDGAATQAIVGVGFQPKGIIIYVQSNVMPHYMPHYKITQDGLNSIWGGGTWVYINDNIISLDADGFTVGDNTFGGANLLNINLVQYTYIAFG